MRTEPRIPVWAWIYTGCGLWCFGVVVCHVSAIASGRPLASVWWALPLNILMLLIDLVATRREVRRAVQRARQMQRL